MATRLRFQSLMFEGAVITRVVALSLGCLKHEHELWFFLTVIFGAIGAVMLLLSAILHTFRRFRMSMAPVTYIVLMIISALFGCGEAVIYGLNAKMGDEKRREEVLIAAMGYSILSVLIVFILITVLCLWPPQAEFPVDVEKQSKVMVETFKPRPKSNRERSQKNSHSISKSSQKSLKLNDGKKVAEKKLEEEDVKTARNGKEE
ncbi:hypothetical protein M3Y96_00137200 [Aphelenchoides besseyi]|nr:hypothetical protein M3Y96_00137200 [Aphelenchoides besseyi]